MAKVYGSYEAMEGGKPYQAFTMLTGFPTDIIWHTNPDSIKHLWPNMLEATTNKWPMVASVNSTVLG